MTEIQNAEGATPDLGRRSVLKGAAWSVPVIAAAVATPLAAATTGARLDLNAGCFQVLGVGLLPGFSVVNTGTASYDASAPGNTITVVETIDLSAITTPGLDILGGTVRTALWAILLVEGILSGASAGVSRGNWVSGGGLVPKTYSRTVTITGTIAAGDSKVWGNAFDITRILNVLESFGLAAIKRSAVITAPTGNPPVVDAGPSDLSYSLLGGC